MDLLQPDEAAHHQPRADEQHERQRDFSLRRARCGDAAAPRVGESDVLARSVRFRSWRAALSAGTVPNTIAVTAVIATVNTRTEASMRISAIRGRFAGIDRPQDDESGLREAGGPTRPPAAASTRLSVTSCRTRRSPRAPSAARSAISCCRAVDRASSRCATLAQAMSSTNADRADECEERRDGRA